MLSFRASLINGYYFNVALHDPEMLNLSPVEKRMETKTLVSRSRLFLPNTTRDTKSLGERLCQ